MFVTRVYCDNMAESRITRFSLKSVRIARNVLQRNFILIRPLIQVGSENSARGWWGQGSCNMPQYFIVRNIRAHASYTKVFALFTLTVPRASSGWQIKD